MRLYTYSLYTGNSRRKKLTRILLLCALAAAIFLSLLLLGNILNDRLEKATPLLALPAVHYGTDGIQEPDAPNVFVYSQKNPANTVPGAFCALRPAEYKSETELREACALASELYDGLTVTVSDAAGARFSLDAWTTDGETDGTLPGTDALRSAAACAAENALTSCAILSLSGVSDTEAAAELSALGFSEILFTGTGMLDEGTERALRVLTDAIRATGSGIRIGFALFPDVFTDAQHAPQLEALAGYADFLALDTSDCAADEERVLALCDSLRGSIGYYSLRILLLGDAARLAAQAETLRASGFPAVLPQE